MDIILKYFPKLSEHQIEQYRMLDELYKYWNERINVISRKDIDNLYEHHVLHSLAIAKGIHFHPGSTILDFGTGGGFPGIPLAIMFPECRFKMIDGTGKKISVANDIAQKIHLENCEIKQLRGEEEKGKYDFIVSRAVMPMPDLVKMMRKNISSKQRNAMMNGIIALKGGNVEAEIQPFRKTAEVIDIDSWFDEDWFKEKHFIYIPI